MSPFTYFSMLDKVRKLRHVYFLYQIIICFDINLDINSRFSFSKLVIFLISSLTGVHQTQRALLITINGISLS